MSIDIDEEFRRLFASRTTVPTRVIENFLKTGVLSVEGSDKRNATRQAGQLYRIVNDELYRYGTEKEYSKYGLRIVVHDDQVDKKIEIVRKCHLDEMGNHLGTSTTQKNIAETYYWIGITCNVQDFIRRCDLCKVRIREPASRPRASMEADTFYEGEEKPGPTCEEAQKEIKKLGKIRRSSPPETFFIVNTDKKINVNINDDGNETVMIDSNNIEYVVETLGHSEDGTVLNEVCHVLNVPEIVPLPDRYRSREIENYLKYGSFPEEFTINQKNGLKNPATQYTIIDDELYHDANKSGSKGVRQVIHDDQPALKVKTIVENHIDDDGGHCGLNKTLTKISARFHWVGMTLDVRKFMMQCKLCNSNRAKKSVKQWTQDNIEVLKKQAEQQNIKAMNKMQAEPIVKSARRNKLLHDSDKELVIEGAEDVGGGAENEEPYNQVIRFVGPNDEVMEIMVPAQNENDNEPRMIQLENGEVLLLDGPGEYAEVLEEAHGEDERRLEIVTEDTGIEEDIPEIQENTDKGDDIAAQVKAETMDDEAEHLDENQYVKMEVLETDVTAEGIKMEDGNHSNSNETNEEIPYESHVIEIAPMNAKQQNEETTVVAGVDIETETDFSEEIGSGDGVEEKETDIPIDNDESTNALSEANVEDEDEMLEVVILEADGKKQQKFLRRSELEQLENVEFVENMDEFLKSAPDIGKRQMERLCDDQSYLFNDIIHVPHLKYTRVVEEFLETGKVTAAGFNFDMLKDVSNTYYMEDGVLFRRPSRYKSGHIVVHDDMPEYKLKLIEQHHLKPNGAHCTRKVTEMKLAFQGREIYQATPTSQKGRLRGVVCNQEDGEMTYIVQTDENATDADIREIERAIQVVEPDTHMGGEQGEESDVEVHIPESDEDDSTQSKAGRKMNVVKVKFSPVGKPVATQHIGVQNKIPKVISASVVKNKEPIIVTETFGRKQPIIVKSPPPRQRPAVLGPLKPKTRPLGVWKTGLKGDSEQPGKTDMTVTVASSSIDVPPSKSSARTLPKEVAVNSFKTAAPVISVETVTLDSCDLEMRVVNKRGEPAAIVEKGMADPVIKDKPSTAASTPGSLKRPVSAVTPASEGRRPRREIKRPRRFSPESKDRKLLTVKTEPVEIHEDDDTEEMIKIVKPAQTTPGVSRARRDQQMFTSAAKVVRRKSKSGKVEITIHESQDDIEDGLEVDDGDVDDGRTVETIGIEADGDGEEEQVDHSEEETREDNSDDEELEEMEGSSEEEGDDEKIALETLVTEGIEQMKVVKGKAGYSCSLCNAKFTTERQCSAHGAKNSCYEDCGLCGCLYKKSQLQEYMQHVALHETAAKFPCEICRKVFVQKQHQEIHERLHQKTKHIKCQFCRYSCYTNFQLASHMLMKHKKWDNMEFHCDICGAKFLNVKFMKFELKVDGELSYFKCIMCSNNE
ncbi:ZN653-like protein [Mya arenaria]|uniref:ZN653-like protein n=1 Tax=Mya arenaria TaxID=6604 RepID=A0ABY7FI20_MYAAR|nr:ZN653-like protein [Mya arenaria]